MIEDLRTSLLLVRLKPEGCVSPFILLDGSAIAQKMECSCTTRILEMETCSARDAPRADTFDALTRCQVLLISTCSMLSGFKAVLFRLLMSQTQSVSVLLSHCTALSTRILSALQHSNFKCPEESFRIALCLDRPNYLYRKGSRKAVCGAIARLSTDPVLGLYVRMQS